MGHHFVTTGLPKTKGPQSDSISWSSKPQIHGHWLIYSKYNQDTAYQFQIFAIQKPKTKIATSWKCTPDSNVQIENHFVDSDTLCFLTASATIEEPKDTVKRVIGDQPIGNQWNGWWYQHVHRISILFPLYLRKHLFFGAVETAGYICYWNWWSPPIESNSLLDSSPPLADRQINMEAHLTFISFLISCMSGSTSFHLLACLVLGEYATKTNLTNLTTRGMF